jgi:23S rRNA pseudouridine2605 synthase
LFKVNYRKTPLKICNINKLHQFLRREAEKWIKEGRINLNGCKVNIAYVEVSYDDDVTLDGERITVFPNSTNKTQFSPRIWAAHKLRGELVADNDPIKNRPLMLRRLNQLTTIVPSSNNDLSIKSHLLKPISRLDFNTEGLCLLSNSGILAKALGSSTSNLMRYYRMRVHGLITDSKLDGLKKGMYINGKKQPPHWLRPRLYHDHDLVGLDDYFTHWADLQSFRH